MSRPILQQCLWAILSSCACLASCLLPLSLSSYPMKSFRTFRGLHQSDHLSWSNFSVSVINGLFSKYNLSSTCQKINWNTHMLFDSRMICYSYLRDAAHTVSEHIERGPFFWKNLMIRDLLLAIPGIDVSSWAETLTSFFLSPDFLSDPVWWHVFDLDYLTVFQSKIGNIRSRTNSKNYNSSSRNLDRDPCRSLQIRQEDWTYSKTSDSETFSNVIQSFLHMASS